MQITYLLHAEGKIAERGIGKELVEDALENPDDVILGRDGRKICIKLIGCGKALKVIYEQAESAYIVVTADLVKEKRIRG